MNILDIDLLFEKSKFAKEKTIAYHGTNINNLRSILKQGLVPSYNPGTGYGRDNTDILGFNLNPVHEGVYLTRKFYEANTIHGESKSLVVIVQVELRETYIDEDDIGNLISLPMERMYSLKNTIIRLKQKDLSNIEYKDQINDLINDTIEQSHDKFKIIKTLYPEKTADHAIDKLFPDIKKYIEKIINGYAFDKIDNHEKEVKELKQKITKYLRHMLTLSTNKTLTFVIPHRIGYKGANKILGLYYPKTKKYWGDVKNYIPESGKEKVEQPLELINEH